MNMLEIYSKFDKLFNYLYNTNSSFNFDILNYGHSEVIFDSNGVPFVNGQELNRSSIIGFIKDIQGLDVSRISYIYFNDIFNYDMEEGYLYQENISIGEDKGRLGIVFYNPDSEDYPSKEIILRSKNTETNLVKKYGIPRKLAISLKAITDYFRNKEGNLFRIHMVGEELVVSKYSRSSSSISKEINMNSEIYGNINNVLSELVKLGKPVKELYWFSEGRYGCCNVKECSDGECILVIF